MGPSAIFRATARRFAFNFGLKWGEYWISGCGGATSQLPGKPVQAPDKFPAFPDAKRAELKTYIGGTGRKRRRWKDLKGTIYEWDYQHGRVEKYDKRGIHQGEFDHISGERLKAASPGRRVQAWDEM